MASLEALVHVLANADFRAAAPGDVNAELRERAEAVAHGAQGAAWAAHWLLSSTTSR